MVSDHRKMSFLPFSTSSTKKRAHFDLSKFSVSDESLALPGSITFGDFCTNLKPESKLIDFAKAVGDYLDSNQRRKDAKDVQQVNSLAAVRLSVAINANARTGVEKIFQRYDANMALFELIMGRIDRDKIEEVRTNFVDICKFLKVPLEDADIVFIRFLKRDSSRKKIKSHNTGGAAALI